MNYSDINFTFSIAVLQNYFYIVTLSNHELKGIFRKGFSLKEQNLLKFDITEIKAIENSRRSNFKQQNRQIRRFYC